MFVDIHTHIDNQSVIRIVDECGEKILTTVGVHPWEVESVEEASTPLPCASVEMTAAVGEVGLDKAHRDTFEKQVEVFRAMVELSESYRKPMIVHCVRAYSELIAMRKSAKAKMPWVIHGFNGSVETMLQLLRHDMYISLGEVLYRNEPKAAEILKNLPVERLFLETDVSGRNIKDVYAKAATLMECEVDFLCKQIFENYGRLETTNGNIGG